MCFSYEADAPRTMPAGPCFSYEADAPRTMPAGPCFSYPLICFSYPADTAQPTAPELRTMPYPCFRY